MKNLGEKGTWAYPGTAEIFRIPPIISGMGKATNFEFRTHIHRINWNKSPLQNFRKSSRGRTQGLSKNLRAPIYRAHHAIIFAVAQLSCLRSVVKMQLHIVACDAYFNQQQTVIKSSTP